jgi:integrase
LGISTALRYSDLSKITWKELLGSNKMTIKEKKTGRVREIPLSPELIQNLTSVYLKQGSPDSNKRVIPLTIWG